MKPVAGQPATQGAERRRAPEERYAVEAVAGPSEPLLVRARSGVTLLGLILILGACTAVAALIFAAVFAAFATTAIS